jgi:hypothetical protein
MSEKTISKPWVVILLVAIVVSACFSLFWQTPEQAVSNEVHAPMLTSTAVGNVEPTENDRVRPQLNEVDEAQFIANLTQKFASVIEVKHAQIRLLEQLISYLKSRYPEDWESRVEALLAQMYPDLAAELLAKYQSWSNYNAWLLTERDVLRAMSPLERRNALWAKRFDAFGADAEQIWAAELRNRKIEEALIAVDEMATGLPEEKLTQFVASVRDALGDKAEPLLATRRTELMDRFLSLDSVQQELRNLPDSTRLASLREIRSGLGMDAQALDRWAALDKRRDELWTTGSNYMEQRQIILAEYTGGEQRRRLQALQTALFAEQSELIQREEQSGFFRFAGERRIGRE